MCVRAHAEADTRRYTHDSECCDCGACCSVLQGVILCYSVLQCVAVHCSALQRVYVCVRAQAEADTR